MSRTLNRKHALAMRKQLLIAESELNRIRLAAATAGLHAGLHTMAHGATTVGAIASSTAMLATNLAAIPRKKHTGGTKSLWLQTGLYAAVLISSAWLALIPRKT